MHYVLIDVPIVQREREMSSDEKIVFQYSALDIDFSLCYAKQYFKLQKFKVNKGVRNGDDRR